LAQIGYQQVKMTAVIAQDALQKVFVKYQAPGKDFQENHAPVISDTTLHLLMIIKTIFKLEAGQFDIETAFLYGKIDEDL
jgi:hypothetical protein